MSNKYSGYDERDTSWDDYHMKNGMMTNHEFFTSNGPGGFYEGMEWDEEDQEWVPNAESRERQAAIESNRCEDCGCLSCACW